MPDDVQINLLIADDHQLITDGLTQILQGEKGIGKIQIAKNGREAASKALAGNIDCVIMDINMPELNGLDATKLIKKEKPNIKIIVVSMLCEPSVVSKLLKAGADAFINKDTGKAELLKAISRVMHNETYISAEIANNLFRHLDDKNLKSISTEIHLTKRELEIIRLIGDGLTDNEIASRLFISHVTVSTHRKNMLAKLGLKNTASLVRYAADNKLL